MASPLCADQRLAPEPASVRVARRTVGDAVGTLLSDGDRDDLLLATSEVVTNAVEHGAPPIGLRVEQCDGHVRVEVRDASPLPPRRRDIVPAAAEVRGRGLLIVERAADRWGVDETAGGKTVWFEVDLGPGRGS